MKPRDSLKSPTGRIKQWPAEERPRERLILRGPEALSDAQLLAIVLRNGGGGQTALDLAMALLQKFGDLRGIGTANIMELCATRGVGQAKAAQLKASFELGKRHASLPLKKRQKITCSRDIYEVYWHYFPQFRDLRKEVFKIILLDGKHRIFSETVISEGSLTASLVHPREVFTPAIRNSAAAIVLLHNHPSGDPTPSSEDVEITRRLISAGEILGIKVLDHVILGDGKYASFVDSGLM